GDHRDLHSFPTRRSSDLLGCRQESAKQSSPTDSRPVWIPSQPSNQEDWQSIQQTWRRAAFFLSAKKRTLSVRSRKRSPPSIATVNALEVERARFAVCANSPSTLSSP